MAIPLLPKSFRKGAAAAARASKNWAAGRETTVGQQWAEKLSRKMGRGGRSRVLEKRHASCFTQVHFVHQRSELSAIYFFRGNHFWSLMKLNLRRGSPSPLIVVVVAEHAEFFTQFNFVENLI